jgi:hypothetical protein
MSAYTHIPPHANTGDLFAHGERLGKLIRLLSSDKDGEVVAAARALARVLADSGGDIHHLADLVSHHWHPPIVLKPERKPERKRKPRPHSELAAELLSHPEILGRRNGRLDSKLLERERDFLETMMRLATCSAGQWKWLTDIESRMRRAA